MSDKENNFTHHYTVEELIVDDPKGGLTIKSFVRKGDIKKKVTIKESGDNKFNVRTNENNKVVDVELNMTKLKEYLDKNKNTAFALNYINKDMVSFRKGKGKAVKTRTRKQSTKKQVKKTSKRKTSKKKASKPKVSKKKTSKRKSSKK